jgi:hypothetical protein
MHIHHLVPAPPGWTAHYQPDPTGGDTGDDKHHPIAGWMPWNNYNRPLSTPIGAHIHDTNGDLAHVSDFGRFCCITGPGQPPHRTERADQATEDAGLSGPDLSPADGVVDPSTTGGGFAPANPRSVLFDEVGGAGDLGDEVAEQVQAATGIRATPFTVPAWIYPPLPDRNVTVVLRGQHRVQVTAAQWGQLHIAGVNPPTLTLDELADALGVQPGTLVMVSE